MDSDLYFWEDTDVPFTKRRDPALRNEMLRAKIASLNGYIIGGGSLPKWDESWFQAFDLVVFQYIPSAIRIQRLKQRELERYGPVIFEDDERNRLYTEFIAWCSGYDDNTASGRTLRVNEEWIEKFVCPVVQIREDSTIQHRSKHIIRTLKQWF